MMRRNIKYVLAGSVALMTFCVYLASLNNEFVEWDDSTYVFANPFIRSFDLAFLKWAFLNFYAFNWHPLTWISHAMDYAIWGLNPLGHHLTNNILHAVNTFVVVLLVARLMSIAQNRAQAALLQERAIVITAATTGLLFGLHPLHVESVAWVAERKDLLCGLFYLLSVMAYTSYRSYSTYRTYILSLFFFILALLSKPMAVSLPVVLLVLDWYPFGQIRSFKTFRGSFVEKLPFIALSLGSSILTVLAQRAGGSIVEIEVIPLSIRMLVAVKSLIAYLWKMILPLQLLPYYPYPNDVSFFSAEYLSAMIVAVVITAACIVVTRKQKVFLSVWTYYVATLVPVLGFIQVGGQSMADRYSYLPSIGPFLLLGLLTAWLSEKVLRLQRLVLRIALFGLGMTILLSLSFLTFKQATIWKNSITLWSFVIEKEPQTVPVAYNNRGFVFYEQGQFYKAIEDYDKAIALNSSNSDVYYNRGNAFDELGQFDKAIADYNKAIALNPLDSGAYNNRGLVFEKIGEIDKAIADYGKAVALDSSNSEASKNRRSALEKKIVNLTKQGQPMPREINQETAH
jgi:protein O-mannosyl-transferase